MEAVIFDGKEYVKASVLAKKFRYTADYLGQLCRGKKVDARLVGRAWYINLESLNQHRDGRYKTVAVKNNEQEAEEVLIKKPRSNYLSRIEVEPILKKKTVALFKTQNGTLSEFPVKYENDEYSLIPRVNKQAISKNIPINPAESEKMRVHKEGAAITDFKAEQLPEVYLKGTLKVAGLEEATESLDPDDEKIQPEIKSELMSEPKKVTRPIMMVRPLKRRTQVGQVAVTPERLPAKVAVHSEEEPSAKVETRQPERQNSVTLKLKQNGSLKKLSQRPSVEAQKRPVVRAGVAASAVKQPVMIQRKLKAAAPATPPSFKPLSVVKKEEKRSSQVEKTPGWSFPILLVLMACASATFLLVTEAEITATRDTYQLHFSADIGRLESVLKSLKNL